jgi:hypothetical protein
VLGGLDTFRSFEGDDFGGHTTAKPLNRDSAGCAENWCARRIPSHAERVEFPSTFA